MEFSQTAQIQNFIDTIINNNPQPQTASKLFTKLVANDFYKFGAIYRRMVETAIINDIYIPYNYRDYGMFNEDNITDNNTKILLFLKHKTAKQVEKYVKLLPKQFLKVFEIYITNFSVSCSQYTIASNSKYLLPKPLRKMKEYNFNRIKTYIKDNIPDRQNAYYYI